MKKEIYISGEMVFPLKEGAKAVIRADVGLICTSPVVKIFEEGSEYICFETMNSVYMVYPQPVPLKAAAPILKICA